MAAGRQKNTRQQGRAAGSVHERGVYVYGSAVPKETVEYRPKKPKTAGTSAVRANNRIRRNQERAMYMDLPYVILLTIACAITLYLCIDYLQVQSSITARMQHIEELEADIESLKAENDALETRINTSIDLQKIYDIATGELGMVYAKKSQVLLYDKTESEYVRQYEDIPEY